NSTQIELATPDGLPATRPYFSRPGIEQAFYKVSVPTLRNAPATPAPLTVTAEVSDNGVPITVRAIVAKAQQSGLPAVVVPPLSVSIAASVGIVTPKDRTFNVAAQVHSNTTSPASGTVTLLLPDHKPADGGPQNFSF